MPGMEARAPERTETSRGFSRSPNFLPVMLLQLGDILHDLRLDLVVDLLAVLIVLGAGLGGDGEALGHRQANVGHFGQVGTLAAKQLPHVGVALAEQIDILFAHVVQTSLSCRSRKSGGLQSAVKRLAHFDNDNIILGIFSENNT